MSTLTQVVFVIALVLSIILPFGYYLIGERNRGRYKTSLAVNVFFFFGFLLVASVVALGSGSTALAAETTAEAQVFLQEWAISQQR